MEPHQRVGYQATWLCGNASQLGTISQMYQVKLEECVEDINELVSVRHDVRCSQKYFIGVQKLCIKPDSASLFLHEEENIPPMKMMHQLLSSLYPAPFRYII